MFLVMADTTSYQPPAATQSSVSPTRRPSSPSRRVYKRIKLCKTPPLCARVPRVQMLPQARGFLGWSHEGDVVSSLHPVCAHLCCCWRGLCHKTDVASAPSAAGKLPAKILGSIEPTFWWNPGETYAQHNVVLMWKNDLIYLFFKKRQSR